MADGNASILEGALGVHGHVVQSSVVSPPPPLMLPLRVVGVLFPPLTARHRRKPLLIFGDENITLHDIPQTPAPS